MRRKEDKKAAMNDVVATTGRYHESRVEAAVKPLLRGYLHLGAAILAVIGTIALVVLATGDPPKQVTLAVYGLSSIWLFGMSALYHIGKWEPQREKVLRRLDHANIFILIAGTYTPIAFNVMTGWWRIGILVTVWGLALAGVIAAAPRLSLPRWVMVALYLLTGWVALAAIPEIGHNLGIGAILTLVLGGVLYTLGALAYAFKRPNPWPRVFGYHEVFHLCTIAANAVFFAFMVIYVVPFVRL
jgi:hemolysin III